MRNPERGTWNGSIYVGLVFVALAGYFVYQTWFNPSRAVKQRLGQIAGALSVPASESEFDRTVRLSTLRGYLAENVRVRAGQTEFNARDTVVGALSNIRAVAGALDLQCVDVQVSMESESSAHTGMMLEVSTHDPPSGELRSNRYETITDLEKRAGEWVVVRAEIRTRSPQ
ncbi:MAG TPA: hypothetical protein VKH42_02025 [Vicinamibacterales bacterium]|nr:hypothetical protein [Vicinamibacterales bacterium]